MTEGLSLKEMLADLERRLAFHRAQEAIHAQQETVHRDERARHAAAVETVAQQLAALQEASSSAESFLREAAPLPAPPAPPAKDAEAPPRLGSQMIGLVVRDWPADRSFTARAVTAEVNRRFAEALRRPISLPTVARTLLRFKKKGRLRVVREGVSHKESVYKRSAERTSEPGHNRPAQPHGP